MTIESPVLHSAVMLANVAGISHPTIKKYADLGLLPHERYGSSGKVAFTPDQVRTIRRFLRDKGLRGIREGAAVESI